MSDLSEMWTICHDCSYFEVCEPPYNCAVTESKYRQQETTEEQKAELHDDEKMPR